MPKNSTRNRAMRRRRVPIEPAFTSPQYGDALARKHGVPIAHLRLESFEVTSEPFPETFLDVFTPEDIEIYRWVANRMDLLTRTGALPSGADRQRLDDSLDALMTRYPHVPKVFNLRSGVLHAVGPEDVCDRFITECFERFPRYIFSFCDYIRLLVAQNRIEEAKRVMGNVGYSLTSFCPERKLFHITEVMTWHHAVGVFLIAEGNPQRAKPYLRILEDYAPDASVTTDLRARMKLMDLADNSPMEFFKLVASAGVGTR